MALPGLGGLLDHHRNQRAHRCSLLLWLQACHSERSFDQPTPSPTLVMPSA